MFLFNDRISGFGDNKSGCYHFKPATKSLQLIKQMSEKYFIENLSHGLFDDGSKPHFYTLYLAHMPKALFKYRYRGLRHAVLEAGSMYQNAIFCSQSLGLDSCVWGSFSENEILSALDMNISTYFPLMMQIFGDGIK